MVSKNEFTYSLLNYFRSEDLALKADVVFSETLSVKDFNSRKIDAFIIHKNKEYLTYVVKNFNLKDGDIIFCHSDYLEILFKSLKNKKIFNLKLISHQSDRTIGKKIFQKMPSSIIKWYSINVNYSNTNLIPIPIGLANKIYTKNLNPEIYKDNQINKEKIEKIYINFNPNTNFYIRQKIINEYKNNCDFYINTNKLNNLEYLKEINRYKYVLCPPGNGIDTHRFWEVLNAGSTPVALNSLNYRNFHNLNAIFLNDFKNISIEELNEVKRNESQNLSKFFYDLINEIYEKKINENKIKQIISVDKKNIYLKKCKNYFILNFNLIYKPARSKFFKFYFKIFN